MSTAVTRCKWAEDVSPAYTEYHDKEWGVPVFDDRVQFEFLILEGAQAGLSWSTILNKREGYREAFAEFDPQKVARFTEKRVDKLLQNPGIVRNRLKVQSTVSNAKAFLAVQKEFGSSATISGVLLTASPSRIDSGKTARSPLRRPNQMR